MLTPIESTNAPAGRGDSAVIVACRIVPMPLAAPGMACVPPEQFASPSASKQGTVGAKRLLAENRTKITFS
jgi:hypothetical protein